MRKRHWIQKLHVNYFNKMLLTRTYGFSPVIPTIFFALWQNVTSVLVR